jgi:hypothetical protein
MKESFENKMNDKFRKVLESYQVQYDQRAWERLSGELPVKPVSKWIRWRLLAGWAFGILVAGLIIYLGYWPTIEPIGISQPKQNTVSAIVKKENAQSGNLISHPIEFSKKNQLVGKGSLPQETLGQELLAKAGSIKSNGNEYGIPANETTEIKHPELVSAKAGLVKAPEIKFKLKELPAKKAIALEPKKQKSKLRLPKLNIDFSGDRYSHFVGPNKLSIYYNPEFQMENKLRNPGLVHGLGVEIEGPINPKINLAVGFNYFSKQYSGIETFRLDSSKVSGLHVAFVDSTINRTGKYHFFEMPVTIRLNLYSGQRSSLFFDGGFSVIAFLKQEYNTHTVVNLEETDNNITQKAWKNIHPLGSLNLGLTYRYSLSERFSICGSVGYKNHLSKLGALPMELDRVSVKVGIVYRFGRKDEN